MEFLKGFATAALLVAGCAPSPLLRPDDATFAFADARFAAVSESILGQSGPRKLDVPEALFLRAEALYDYRFALTRGETASSYLAQLAAAATDFAPLTVVAASGAPRLAIASAFAALAATPRLRRDCASTRATS